MVDFARLKKIIPAETQWVAEDPSQPDGPAFLLAPLFSAAWYRVRDTHLQDPWYQPLLEEQRRQARARTILLEPPPSLPILQQQALDALELELNIEVTLATVLLDWRGQTSDGAEVPYTKDVARENLQIEAFRDLIASLAPRPRQGPETAKNSGTASAGH